MFKQFYQQPKARAKPQYIAPTPAEDEQLTGSVQNMPASDNEERFARSLYKNKRVQGFEFRKAIGAPKGMPGWKELDFLVSTISGFHAFEIDDTSFVHKGESARTKDRLSDITRRQALERDGIQLPAGIEHVDASAWLQNQESSDRRVRELIQ